MVLFVIHYCDFINLIKFKMKVLFLMSIVWLSVCIFEILNYMFCYKMVELEKNEQDVVIDDIYPNIRQELFHYSFCENWRLTKFNMFCVDIFLDLKIMKGVV